MALTLHNIHPKKGSRKGKKRVGRGLASKGRYSGRGIKGQRSRSGGKSGLKLKGLREIMLSTPKKRGFTSGRTPAEVINIAKISKLFKEGAKITPKTLLAKKAVSNISHGVKILGVGTITIKVTVADCLISATAQKKIEEAGGTVVLKK